MATSFPVSLDELINPQASNSVQSPSHSEQHADANDAIEALEAKVGIDGSSVVTSHDYKIAQLQSLVTSAVAGAKSIYQDVRNQSGSAFTKATPVYVSGSTGASGQLLVSAASNATEATSSKTMGITTSAISNNSNGQVISEGILEGIDTTGAADGDPVWLGVNGAKIYGLINKPSAPAHLVFLGIVIRGGQANTGSIYVKIQNGFEMEELHNVQITSPATGEVLVYDATTSLWKNSNTIASKTYVDNAITSLSNTAANTYVPVSDVGNPDGVASLDSTGKVPDTQIPAGIARDSEVSSAISTAVNNLINSAPGTLDTLGEIATQLAADESAVGALTTVVNGKVSKAGGSLITPSSASTAGLSFTPASGQTANLLEFIGGPAGGGVKVGPGGNIFDAPAINANYSFVATAGGSGVVPSIIKGAASQTANLTEWQNSSGTILAKVDKDGNIGIGAGTNALSAGLDVFTGSIRVWNGVTGSGQTGTIYLGDGSFSKTYGSGWTFNGGITTNNEIYITGGTLHLGDGYLTKTPGNPFIINSGFWVNGAYLTVGGSNINYNNSLTVYSGSSTRVGAVIQGASSQSVDLQQWQNSAGTVLAKVDKDGNFNNQSSYASILTTSVAATGGNISTTYGFYNNLSPSTNAGMAVMPWAANLPGAIVRGFAGQTANLQEWQNSSGTILGRIASNGFAEFIGGLSVQSNAIVSYSLGIGGASAYLGNAILAVSTANGATSSTGILVRGVSGQTGDLQQWQNNSGTVLAKVDSTGAMFTITPADSTNSTQVATTAYVKSNIANLVSSAPAALDTLNELATALGNDANFSTTITNSLAAKAPINSPTFTGIVDGITKTMVGLGSVDNTSDLNKPISTATQSALDGKVSKNGGDTITVSSASTKGLTIRSVASQTANLQEWQDSSGTVIAKVFAAGYIYGLGFQVPANTTALFDSSNLSGTISLNSGGITIEPRLTTNVGLIVKSMDSQTADLQQWQNSSGTVITKITANGAIDSTVQITGRSAVTAGTGSYLSASLNVVPLNASIIGAVIRRVTSQTADLMQWQDQNGGILGTINKDGAITLNSSTSLGAALNAYTSWSGATGIIVKGSVSQSANLQEWQNSAGTALASITSAGVISGGGLSISTPTNTINAGTFYNSAGTIVFNVDTTNNAVNIGGGLSGITNNFGSTWGYDSSLNAGYISFATGIFGGDSFAIRRTNHIASGDYTLSTLGNLRFSTASGKNFNFNNGNIGIATTAIGTNNKIIVNPYSTIDNLATVQINTNAATNKGLVVQGYASQSADLTQWQDNSGNVLAKVDANGFSNATGYRQIGGNSNAFGNTTTSGTLTTFGPGGNASIIPVVVRGTSSQTADLQQWQNSAGTVLSRVASNGVIKANVGLVAENSTLANYTALQVNSTITNGNGIIVVGASGQTANLQEWQNSSGTVLAKINGVGQFVSDVGFAVTAGNYGGAVGYLQASSASYVGLIIKAAASQTANLQEWQNSSGTTLLSITPNGSIKGGNSNTISVNTASTVDTSALSSFTSMEYTLSIKQGSKIRSSKVLVHTDGTSVDSTEYGIMEMGGGISGILVTASVSSTNAILQVTITDAATTNATVKLIKTML